MAYFSNGTSGGMWEDCNCGKGRGCYHARNDRDCPLMEAHAALNYDQYEREPSRLPDWLRWLRQRTERVICRIKDNPFWCFRRRSRPLTGRAKGIKEVLEILIPTSEEGWAEPCRMYHDINPTYDVDMTISTQEAFEAQYLATGD